jgi:hypothetical protein
MISTSNDLIQFKKVEAFTKDGSKDRLPLKANFHILQSWKTSTLLGYNSAVKKFVAFQKSERIINFSLLITGADFLSLVIAP